MAALIDVDDLGQAQAGKGQLKHLAGVAGLQRDGHLVRQHPTADHVNHGGKVDKALRHANVGRVQRPDLVGPADGQAAQQVRVDLVARSAMQTFSPCGPQDSTTRTSSRSWPLYLFTNYVNVAFAMPVDFPAVKLRRAA